MPRALLAEDAGRFAVPIDLDDAARNPEIAVRERERRGVEPQRMTVARLQRDGPVTADRIEVVPRRFDGRRPVAAPPAATSQPARAGRRLGGRANTRERFVE